MSSRSMSPPPASPGADLDSTAELPVLDPPAAPAAADEHTSTDTWAALPQLRPDHEQHLEKTLEAMSAELRSAQQLLNSKGDRLSELEREREEARAAHAAAEERAVESAAAVARLEAAAAQHATQHAAQVAELTQARLGAEQSAAGLAAELAHLHAGGDSTASTLVELRAAAEQRAAHLDAELARLRSAATQHAAQFGELTQARTVAEQRIVQLDAELATAREQLRSATAHAAQLEQRLQEQAQAAQAERARGLQHEQARAERERTHAAHAASAMADLHDERARAMSYFESLQSVESRRALFENLVTDMHEEAHGRESDLNRLAHQLVAAQTHLREQDAELAQRAARLERLEQQVTSLGAALGERDAQLRDGRREAQGLHGNLTRLQAQLQASGERVRALSAVTEQHNTTESQRKSELSRLLAERVHLTTAVEAARASASAAAAQAAEHEGALNQSRARSVELEAALAEERKRTRELEEELGTLRREMEEWGSLLKSVHQERGSYQTSIAAAEARARDAEQLAAEHAEALAALTAESAGHAARVGDLEADLAAAEETVHRLESEARKHATRVEELEKASQQWRAAVEEGRQGAADPSSHPLLRESDEAEPPGTPLPEGSTRLLIYHQDGREIVHVLGRKTSVGRTPDNDLQIDAKFISRHHAVILAGPVQTVIEDLNSTNGVQVNGRRVTRQVLKDGDTVSIGRQQYRFVVRKSNDKR
jgi:chromosome segregation ATPase